MQLKLFTVAAIAASSQAIQIESASASQANAGTPYPNDDMSGKDEGYTSIPQRMSDAYPEELLRDENTCINEANLNADALECTWAELQAQSPDDCYSVGTLQRLIARVELERAAEQGQWLGADIFEHAKFINPDSISQIGFVQELVSRGVSSDRGDADFAAIQAFGNSMSDPRITEQMIVDYYAAQFTLDKAIQQQVAIAIFKEGALDETEYDELYDKEACHLTWHFVENAADFNEDEQITQGIEFDAARKLFPFALNPIKDAESFEEVDVNGSGGISFEEAHMYAEQKTQGLNGLDQAVHEIFELLDTNADDKLSQEEFFGREDLICSILNEDCSGQPNKKDLFRDVSNTLILLNNRGDVTKAELWEYLESKIMLMVPNTLFPMYNMLISSFEELPGQGITINRLRGAQIALRNALSMCSPDSLSPFCKIIKPLFKIIDEPTGEDVDRLFDPLLAMAQSYDFMGDGLFHRVDLLAGDLSRQLGDDEQ